MERKNKAIIVNGFASSGIWNNEEIADIRRKLSHKDTTHPMLSSQEEAVLRLFKDAWQILSARNGGKRTPQTMVIAPRVLLEIAIALDNPNRQNALNTLSESELQSLSESERLLINSTFGSDMRFRWDEGLQTNLSAYTYIQRQSKKP